MARSNDLLELARKPSSDKRSALLRRVTDLFFDGTSVRNVSETALFEEIVLRVVKDVEVEARAELANAIADEDAAPHGLVRHLAEDVIDVSRPILERSKVLDDRDLVDLAASSGDQHRQAIARRSTLSEMVTDVLIEHGSQIVIRSLATNEGARFSPYGFGEMVRRARDDETVQYGLAQRSDLPAEAVTRLAAILTDQLRHSLFAIGLKEPDSLAPNMLDAVRARLSTAFADNEQAVRDVAIIVAEIEGGHTDIDREIPILAQLDRAYDIAVVVAALAKIDHATAMKALTGPAQEPLVVLFRSIDAAWETFEAVLQLRAKRLRKKKYVKNAALARTYQEMDVETARRVLRFLHLRRASVSHAA